MTAQVSEDYKHENSAVTHLIGQDWQKLIDMIESRPGDGEVKSFDGGGSAYQYRAEDNVLRTLQDVKRLRQKDMPLFGRCPETDNFYTVVCSACSMILMPHALKDHYEKRHGGNGAKSHSPNDKQSMESPNRTKAKIKQPLKIEKVDKTKKVKTSPGGAEPAEETIKDSKRLDKLKKGKPIADKLAEAEFQGVATGTPVITTATLRSDRSKQKITRFASDLQPIVALSPIQVVDTEIESTDSRDLARSKKRDKKKGERKPDKIYNPDKHCGVINDSGKPCVRSILCKVHQVALKRAVPNRTMPYDMLIRILKSQNDEEKIKAENGLIRVLKTEPADKVSPDIAKETSGEDDAHAAKVWTSEQQITSIKTEEPPIKRLKIKEEIVEDEMDQNQFTLPSHLEALIDETLKTLKDVDESETMGLMPMGPKPEPLIKWDLDEREPREKPPPSPPHIYLEDIHWHSSHPKPLATNTFGCRLIGGLMSTCKKLDTLRKHLQSVWTAAASSPPSIRSGFNDVYNSGGQVPAPNPPNTNSKNNYPMSKYSKKPNQTKTAKKCSVATAATTPTVVTSKSGIGANNGGPAAGKRKRRSSSNLMSPVQNTSSNASDIISGLLISNPVPIQRTGSATVPALPTGVIPVNSITGNGVPLRLFQGSLPVIASASPNQPATFIQLNLCSPK